MKLENERAIETLADIIDPIVDICNDLTVKTAFKSGDRMKGVKTILKDHSKSVFEILARLDGVEPENYKCDILTLPAKLLDLLNDPNVSVLFQSQDQMTEETFSGLAMENTEVEDK